MKWFAGPQLSSSEVLELGLLEYIADNEDRASGQAVSLDPFKETLDGDDRTRFDDYVRVLVSGGLVMSFESLAGFQGGTLTAAGLKVVEDVRRRRLAARLRASAARRALVEWISDLADQGRTSPRLDRFLESGHNQYLGVPFEKKEIYQASARLVERGYLTGAVGQGGAALRPKLTRDGMIYVENGMQDGRVPISGDVYHINAPDSNVAVNSSKFSQTHSSIDAGVEKVHEALTAVMQALDACQLPQPEEREAAAVIQQGLSQKDPSFLKQIGEKLKSLLAAGAAASLAGAMISLLDSALELLPGV